MALVDALIAKLKSEPLVVVGVIASAVIYVAGKAGLVLDQPTVESVLTPIVVALIGRVHVVPKSKVVK